MRGLYMININNRKLPAGIQSFKVIRREGYLYVDKTDIVWDLVNSGSGNKYNYLSRPRRFGKSLLVDTLQTYFEGRKELFDGLKIMQLEKDWKQYPVIRLDMSRGGANATTLRSYLIEPLLQGLREEVCHSPGPYGTARRPLSWHHHGRLRADGFAGRHSY